MPIKNSLNRQSLKPYSDAWTLIPLNGKRPIDKGWTTKPYARADVIARGGNVGVRLKPDQLVIDIDPRNGGDRGFDELCMDLGIDAATFPRVITGSGGAHYYLRLPEGVRVLGTLPDRAGCEFKSRGQQVVAAGSVHPETGRLYTWDSDHPALALAPMAPDTLLKAIRRPQPNGEAVGGGQYTQEQIATALAALNVEAFCEHDAWFRLMAACHHASNGDAREEFVDWSTGDPKYAGHADLIGRRWDTLHKDKPAGVTYRTLNKILADHGAANAQAAGDASADFDEIEDDSDWLEGGATAISLVESRGLKLNRANAAVDSYENALCAVTRSRILPSWDELKQNVVFRADELPWQEHFGRVLNDHVGRLIRMHFINEFQGVAYSPSKDNLFEALMTIAYGHKFNPVLDYINALEWDGTERVASLFPLYFNCGDDAYARAVSRCFMIGAVRRMRSPGCKFDTMPILRSPQGWNKSTAVKVLFGADWFSDSDLGDLKNKDAALKLRGIWVKEFAEIESLTRAETGALKNFCSSATDRQRDPYGRVAEDTPRRCVFIATVNEGGYLKDTTGARRFWPLELASPINLVRIAADRDQLWAEAAALEARGVSDVLPRELWPVAAERQAEQSSVDPWAATLEAFLDTRATDYKRHLDGEIGSEDDDAPPMLPPNRVHTSELFDALGIPVADQSKDKAQRVRTVMESVLGWHHKHSVRVIERASAGYTRDRVVLKADMVHTPHK